jgi:hypothetical protein
MNRREFLKMGSIYSGGIVISTMFPYLPAFADMLNVLNSDAAFVLIVVPQGMDVALGLDPLVKFPQGVDLKDFFIEYKPEQIISPISGSNILLGPAAASLKGFDFSVINGIFMNDFDNGHDANRQYITTGNGLGQAPDISVALKSVLDIGPLGVLVGQDSPYMGKESVSTTSLTDIASWSKLGDPSSIMKVLSGSSRTRLTESQKSVVALAPFRKPMLNRFAQLEKIGSSSNNSSEALKSLVATIGAGVGRLAEVAIYNEGGQIDSHNDHAINHLIGQTSVWNQIANLFKMAKATQYKNTKDSVFNRTTFLVVSDFARTPYLNANNGKDHNPNTNSVLLAGRGVKAGLTVGKSIITSRKQSATQQSVHSGAPFDYVNGVPVLDVKQVNNKDIDFIYPENVIATVATCVGAKSEQFKSVSPGTPILKSLVKS